MAIGLAAASCCGRALRLFLSNVDIPTALLAKFCLLYPISLDLSFCAAPSSV